MEEASHGRIHEQLADAACILRKLHDAANSPKAQAYLVDTLRAIGWAMEMNLTLAQGEEARWVRECRPFDYTPSTN